MIIHSRTKPSEFYILAKTKLLQFVLNNHTYFFFSLVNFTYSKDVFQAKETNEIGSSAGSYLEHISHNFRHVWLTFGNCCHYLIKKLWIGTRAIFILIKTRRTILGNLSKGIFEQHASAGSEDVSRSTCLDATKVICTAKCPYSYKLRQGTSVLRTALKNVFA